LDKTDQQNLLCIYAAENKLTEIKTMLKLPQSKRVDVNHSMNAASYYGFALYYAAYSNNKKILKLLIKKGADVNNQNIPSKWVSHHFLIFNITL